MNNHENIDTGCTPFQLDTGQDPLDPISIQLPDTGGQTVLEDWNRLINNAIDRYYDAQDKQLGKINSK